MKREYPSLLPEVEEAAVYAPLEFRPLPQLDKPGQPVTRFNSALRAVKGGVQYLIVGTFTVIAWILGLAVAGVLIVSAPLWWLWYQIRAWSGDLLAAEHAAAIWPALIIWGLFAAGILTCLL